ncbi:Alpha/beta hydrolase family protein [Symmachiella dynata]|uniref:Alpha/beta hydrolase family protein n=1 Tax=Symmachiella dynata TaxID=2527995 RepID=A0A517ZNA2_9PLAN|nr:prolyl oligopeptidase family serine peptidase [Symmachiella dynata]QDU43963.1 Alpha/beta hydrolase family protein [Symmachiella dynata]
MAIDITCPECFQTYRVKDDLEGRRVRCQECGAGIDVEVEEEVIEELAPLPTKKVRPRKKATQPKSPQRAAAPMSQSTKLLLGSGAIALLVMCVIGALAFLAWKSDDFGGNEDLYNLAAVTIPDFPDPELETVGEDAFQIAKVQLKNNWGGPGTAMQLWLYLPVGEHADKSLPCVLVAPAGTNLLRGSNLGEGSAPEHIPYVNAGFAVVAYSLDGNIDDPENADGSDIGDAYDEFVLARAGLVNARNALEFALTKVPAIDPRRIFTAGHSSAGTLALLFAEHEPRLCGCAAYAPGSDFTELQVELDKNPLLRLVFPHVKRFLTRSCPQTHVADFQCPLFLFHAEGDQVVRISESRQFVSLLEAQGKNVTFETIPEGDHYFPMLEQGIPQAIEWMENFE